MLAICILIIGCCLSTHLAISLFSLFPQIDPLLPAFPFSFNAITVSPATPREAHQNCLGLSHLLHPPTFCWLPSLVEPFSKRPHHPRLSPGLPSVWLFQFYLTCLSSLGLSFLCSARSANSFQQLLGAMYSFYHRDLIISLPYLTIGNNASSPTELSTKPSSGIRNTAPPGPCTASQSHLLSHPKPAPCASAARRSSLCTPESLAPPSLFNGMMAFM